MMLCLDGKFRIIVSWNSAQNMDFFFVKDFGNFDLSQCWKASMYVVEGRD